MAVVTMKQLLESGVHFGHQTRRWNPKMERYIYTSRSGIHIIDLQQTVGMVEDAYNKLLDIAQNGGRLLFVGTKKQARDVVKEQAVRSGQFYVTQRWLGGTLTNFKTIRKSIRRLHQITRMEKDGTFDRLPKKEVLELQRELERLEKFLGGIKDMRTLPEAVFVVDPTDEKNAVLEARKLNIPVFGIVDTNCDPDLVDVIIPGNDDAIRSIKLISSIFANAFIETSGGVVENDNKRNNKRSSKPSQPRKSKPAPKRKSKPAVKKESKPAVKKESKPAVKKTEKKAPAKKVEKKETPKKVEKKAPAKQVEKKKEAPKKVAPKKETPKKEAPKEVKSESLTEEELSDMTVKELKQLCKDRDMSGYSRLRKAELIEALK